MTLRAPPDDPPGAARRGQSYFAVMEFERFIPARHTVGFEIANRILARAADRIVAATQGASIGRIGHDSVEFTFRADDDAAAERELGKCLALLERRIEIAGVAFHLKGTVAFGATGNQACVGDALFDSVLAALGADGGGRIRKVDATGAGPEQLDDLAILRALPGAIAKGELALVYQPKLDCRSNLFLSAEALLRWNSASLGPVSTDRMITLAERTGAIRDLTLWVLRQTLRDQAVLRAAGHELTIFVNMSGPLIADRPFIAEVLALISGGSGRLGIEITETSVIGDPEGAIANLAELAAAGVPVAIDDFGSGLSSLAYLKRLPVDELKIDRLFISQLTQSNRDPLIVRASIDLAHALEMTVTAEGVEDEMCLSLLRVMGCDTLQGYFISRPIPLEELIGFLKRAQAGSPARAEEKRPVRLVRSAANPEV